MSKGAKNGVLFDCFSRFFFFQMNLPVREDKQRGVYVAGATEEYVTSADEVSRYIQIILAFCCAPSPDDGWLSSSSYCCCSHSACCVIPSMYSNLDANLHLLLGVGIHNAGARAIHSTPIYTAHGVYCRT